MVSYQISSISIGNATLICHDCRPVLVTDPWIKGSAYFGSWTLSHEIPDEQMNSIEHCEFVWISHGHPDHLSAESLQGLRQEEDSSYPDHVGGLIFRYSQRMRCMMYLLLKDKVWTKLSDRIKVLCLCDYNQDATLLIDINGRLIVNMNDGRALGWKRFCTKDGEEATHISFYLHAGAVR